MQWSIPEDAIAAIRDIFRDANRDATLTLARQPAAHEEQLDFQIIAAIDKVGGPLLLGSGAAVSIETHWLGGRRHFMGRWEIADIALVFALRRSGSLALRKVALLQSKRLYPREGSPQELDAFDYMLGMGRLVASEQEIVPLSRPRTFQFDDESIFGAIKAGSDQVLRIDAYEAEFSIPVYYSFYCPPLLPFASTLPRAFWKPEALEVELGCRVLTSHEVHDTLARMEVGVSPKLSDLKIPPRVRDADKHAMSGWPLETFVADEVLKCRQGRIFVQSDDAQLSSLLYERSAPISSAVVVTIDLPAE